MLPTLRRIADGLIGLSAIIGSLGLLFAVAVVLADVIGRNFFRPLTGAHDLTSMTLVILVFGGMAYADRIGGHISVDILERRYPAWLNRAIDLAAALIGAAVFLTIAWTVWGNAKISLLLNLSTNILVLPKAYFQWALCGFSVITASGMLLRAAEIAVHGRAVPQGGRT